MSDARTIRFPCPTCKFGLSAPVSKAGARSRCPKCKQAVEVPTPRVAALVRVLDALPVPEEVEVPPQRDRQRSRSRRNDDHAKQEGTIAQTRGRNTLISIVTGAPVGAFLGAAVGAVVGVIGFGFVGLLLSQYWPVFGGFIELNLAQPWSPARMNLIPVHLFVFGITGLVLGAGAGLLLGLLLGAGAVLALVGLARK